MVVVDTEIKWKSWPRDGRVIQYAVLGLLAVLVFLLAHNARNDMTKADPAGCLLTSHAILHSGSLRLDDYPEKANPKNYKFREIDGHVYYALAFGTSVFFVPAVGIYELMGNSVVSGAQEAHLQRFLAALIVASVFLLGYLLFRIRLDFIPSITLALVFTLGTSLSSTLGTALWNTGLETMALLGASFLVVRHRLAGGNLRPVVLGLLLGAAYFCRPSAMWPGFLMVLYTGIYARSQLWRVLLGGGFWVGLLVLISRVEYGEWLPAYYQAVIQEQQWDPRLVLRGLMISPGRGVLVFSPFLVMILLWLIVRAGRLRRNPLLWGALAGFLFHVLFMVRHVHWWGGSCFGPRLLTDAVVALLPGAVVVAEDWMRLKSKAWRRGLATVFLVLGATSIWIHTAQGLYNQHTKEWNRRPSVERHVFAIFDWRFPQFLASEERLQERMMVWELPIRESLAPGAMVDPKSKELIFLGWDRLRKDKKSGEYYRQIQGGSAGIGVRIENPTTGSVSLMVKIGSDDRQSVAVLFDGHVIGSFELTGPEPQTERLEIPRRLLEEVVYGKDGHRITFEVVSSTESGRHSPGTGVTLWALGWE